MEYAEVLFRNCCWVKPINLLNERKDFPNLIQGSNWNKIEGTTIPKLAMVKQS